MARMNHDKRRKPTRLLDHELGLGLSVEQLRAREDRSTYQPPFSKSEEDAVMAALRSYGGDNNFLISLARRAKESPSWRPTGRQRQVAARILDL